MSEVLETLNEKSYFLLFKSLPCASLKINHCNLKSALISLFLFIGTIARRGIGLLAQNRRKYEL